MIEYLLDDNRQNPAENTYFDLLMLLSFPEGEVFSAKQLKNWLQLAGFKKAQNFNLIYPASAMIAVK